MKRQIVMRLIVRGDVDRGDVARSRSSRRSPTPPRRGDKAAVRQLLKDGADVNGAQGDGMSALHWAAERGDAELADMLLFAGANIGAVTRIGQYTPLHLAAQGGQRRGRQGAAQGRRRRQRQDDQQRRHGAAPRRLVRQRRR